MFFFFAIILIQFIAMLFHRFGTISHIMASTDLSCFHKKEDPLSDEALIEKNAVEIVKQMQKLRGTTVDMSAAAIHTAYLMLIIISLYSIYLLL